VPVLLWIFPRRALPFPLAFGLIIYLAIVMVIDLEHRLVLHPISLFGALLGLGIGIYLHGFLSTLIGGVVGFGIMFLFYYAGQWYVRWMAKRRGMSADEVALGFGDVNLSGIMGLLLGWPAIIEGLFFAILVGGVVSLGIILVTLALKRYRAFTAIPYAPFLILSAFLLYLH
jgi:prepilin signal peptidase PulO-like enzyme (type II secretory pathway)